MKISSVMDLTTKTMDVINGTDSFRIAGIDLMVPDAEDESLTLVMKDGLTKVCDITVSENDGGLYLTCALPDTKGIAKGKYKVRLASHGRDPTNPLAIVDRAVTLATAVPDPPVFTSICNAEAPQTANQLRFSVDGPVQMNITGTNLREPTGEESIVFALSDNTTIECSFSGLISATKMYIDMPPVSSGEHPASGSGDAKLMKGTKTIASVHFTYTTGS